MAAQGSTQQTITEEAEIVEQGAFVDINVTPLVDIFLVLLVILMATSTAILEAGQGQGAGFRVQLPSGSKNEELKAGGDELVIAITKDGEIIARGNTVSMDELAGLLQDEANKGKERLVLVQADEESIHRRVVQVMEAAKKAGLNNLAIATRPEGE
jgi:biopolymer transport protein TolR